jgi:eukaryotic-like serine/threonine-protein kinase
MAVGGTVERGDLIAGRYRLDAEIGSGEVWRATEQGSNATVTLNRVRLSHLAPPERERARERLRVDAGNASLLGHPNISSVQGLVEHDGDPWLVMSYVSAANLDELTTAGPLSPRRAAALGAYVAGALAYAHSPAHGVVHGAVTPRNVLVGAGDHVTLTGFGGSTVAGEGRFAGLAPYVAPEVANGIEGGPQADVFSLAATLYATVEGRPPWGDGDPEQTRAAAMKGVVEPPRRAGALAPVLMRMLESRPRERPAAAEAARMLAEVARTEPSRGSDGSTSRRWWPWIAVAAVLAVVVAVAGLVVWPRMAPGAAVGAGPVPALGDPVAADPCSLIQPEPLERFGKTILDPAAGNFDRCDVYIESGADRAAARVQLVKSRSALPAGVPEDHNGMAVVRAAPANGECVRTMRLSDGYDVRVIGELARGAAPDPCAVADVATETALAVLDRGSVPRRPAPFELGSLAAVDACGLLDAATVATVPGLQAVQPDPGFAGWGCDWQTPPPGASVRVSYDRDEGISPEAGRRMKIAGRDAAARADQDGAGCDVTVLHRPYTDPRGKPLDELLIVMVDQLNPVPDPCAGAVAIATVAVGRLPAAR